VTDAGARRWGPPLRALAAVAIVAALVVLLADQWPHVRPLLADLRWYGVAAAALAVWAGIAATFACWRAVLTALGYSPPLNGAMRIFYLGQLGKYVPGTIWPAVVQMRLGRQYGVPPRATGAAVALFMITLVGTGMLVAVPSLPLLLGQGGAVGRFWWTLLVLPLALVAVLPPVANRLIGLALRLTRREPLPSPLTLAGILRAVGWAAASWLAYGAHAWLLMRELGVTGGWPLFAALTGAFAAAWSVGPLMVIAPAGAGVREAALILLLGGAGGVAGTAPRAQVIAFAVISRLLFTVGDAAWAGVAVLAGRLAGRRAARRSTAHDRPDRGPGERVADLTHVGHGRDEPRERPR
jgi:uncharacterized membrane protein YbhN (UPF0104 family)